jgi:hypothetical protein
MIIDLTAWINSQAVRIKAAPLDMLINIPNIAAINTANRKIVALGKTEDEMKKQSPFGWRAYSGRIGFITPFDAKDFDPRVAMSVLMFYAYKASALVRPGTFGQLLGYLIDRFTYNLQFAGYENVPPERQEQFAQLALKDRVVRRFVVNGQVIKGA